jgi:hypothetical protein
VYNRTLVFWPGTVPISLVCSAVKQNLKKFGVVGFEHQQFADTLKIVV